MADPSDFYVALATVLVVDAFESLARAMSVCQAHGLFGEIKVQRDALASVMDSLSAMRAEAEKANK